jgi:hypothetical protein
MNNHDIWLESFERPRDRGISYFQTYYSYQRLYEALYSKGIDVILCHQYPFLKDNRALLQECIKLCKGSYTNKGPEVREFIYNKLSKSDYKK